LLKAHTAAKKIIAGEETAARHMQAKKLATAQATSDEHDGSISRLKIALFAEHLGKENTQALVHGCGQGIDTPKKASVEEQAATSKGTVRAADIVPRLQDQVKMLANAAFASAVETVNASETIPALKIEEEDGKTEAHARTANAASVIPMLTGQTKLGQPKKEASATAAKNKSKRPPTCCCAGGGGGETPFEMVLTPEQQAEQQQRQQQEVEAQAMQRQAPAGADKQHHQEEEDEATRAEQQAQQQQQQHDSLLQTYAGAGVTHFPWDPGRCRAQLWWWRGLAVWCANCLAVLHSVHTQSVPTDCQK
jgi:hypothetical protein